MQTNTVLSIAERLERLNNYNITADQVVLAPRSFSGVTAFDVEQPDQAAIVGEAIIAFVSGMSEQNQADVRNTYLFATLVANQEHPLESQGKEWYKTFLTVMQDCGWAILKGYYDSTQASGKSFTMDQLALTILGSAAAAAALPGPTSALLLKVATDAMASLQNSEKPLQVFDKNVKNKANGGFAVGSCIETPDKEVILTMGAVRFINRVNQTKVLFVNWDSSSVDLYKGESHMTMVPFIIAKTRDLISGALGDRAVTNVSRWALKLK
ncbi:hypothetical protein PseAD21_02585 [Pseudomonas sp. AD21]|jgi:hypothetical protein|uniref:hypothetical protein n=1 Tax=Pseudomonas sp. AD21 TaxID=396378 RepID=UPI000C867A8C|nr:hypothetical protein [Pseudomonas sp. AD21]PMQ13807.1 hypothetical protein PseAD21_02585 [Pseudomonas sp. AD21]